MSKRNIEQEAIETVKGSAYGIVGYVVYDHDARSPDDWDNVGDIEHHESEHTSMGERIASEVFEERVKEIESGDLIGILCRYEDHGSNGARLREASAQELANVIITCAKKKALDEFGGAADKLATVFAEALTNECVERTKKCLLAEMESWDEYLQGQVYGVVVHDRDGEVLDSCWGFYGLDYTKLECEQYVRSEVRSEREQRRARRLKAIAEANERAHWEVRGVMTV